MVCQGSDCSVTQEVRKYEDVPSGPTGYASITVLDGMSLAPSLLTLVKSTKTESKPSDALSGLMQTRRKS